MKKSALLSILMFLLLLLASLSFAQESSEEDREALSKAAANPLADLMSFPFQNNTNFGLGPYDRANNVLNIQPVLPFKDGRIITRTIIPVVWIPDITAESGYLSKGLADILFTAWYTPSSEEVTWGLGAALEMPTGGRSGDRRNGASGLLLSS